MADSNVRVGGGVTLKELRQELKPITERLDRLEERQNHVEEGQNSLYKRIDEWGADLRKDVGAVSDRLQNLCRDLKEHAALLPAEVSGGV